MRQALTLALVAALVLTAGACTVLVSTNGFAGGAADDGGDADADGNADAGSDSDSPSDAAPDAPDAPTRCDTSKPFGPLTRIPSPVYSASNEWNGFFSDDELTIYFASERGDVANLFVATRPSASGAWLTPTPLSTLNSPQVDEKPWLTSDQLTIYLGSDRPAAFAGDNIFMATRPDVGSAFGTPVLVSELASDQDDNEPWLDPAGNTVYFMSSRSGGPGNLDIYVSTRGGGGAFGVPTPLANINSASSELMPVLVRGELTLYFASDRAGGKGAQDIYVATRTTTTAPFGTPMLVPELNTSARDYPVWISPDNCHVMVQSYVEGNSHLFVAERPR